MPDLDEQLRAEFNRDEPEPEARAVLDTVYARERKARVRRGVAGALLVGAVALAVPVAASALGDGGPTTVVPAAPSTAASPSGTPHVPLGNPPPRTVAFPGIPSYLGIAAAPPSGSFRVPTGAETRFYTSPAGSPVEGLAWVRQPSEPVGLPGLVVELPRNAYGDLQALVTDDPWQKALYMQSFAPSGDNDFVIVYGGDTDARTQVIVSILRAASR
ncbi:hypothetical protein [Asanoa iriomotensis]|uniref:Uncharacterized protein n=1 Tax=Asanoa iriomotensis TaxID=234613 RepID=A0ABQ4BXT8_9ACTN|nr:hypothetical protein [Asanoa iriomotensis]GIF55305.1 hypothetical protein Air01nite_14000 [Asanoa iriomotensis]